jgi:hypothetical protein
MLYLVVDAILNIWIISCRRKCFDLIIILAVHVFIVISVTQRLIHIIHNSEHPASCFVSLDTGTILVSDLLFDVLMSKLTAAKTGRESFYQQRKGFRIESRGQRYELWDFIIKIGSVSLASNFKGILVEVSIIMI